MLTWLHLKRNQLKLLEMPKSVTWLPPTKTTMTTTKYLHIKDSHNLWHLKMACEEERVKIPAEQCMWLVSPHRRHSEAFTIKKGFSTRYLIHFCTCVQTNSLCFLCMCGLLELLLLSVMNFILVDPLKWFKVRHTYYHLFYHSACTHK